METPLIRVELNENGSKGCLGATRSLKHRVTLRDPFFVALQFEGAGYL